MISRGHQEATLIKTVVEFRDDFPLEYFDFCQGLKFEGLNHSISISIFSRDFQGPKEAILVKTIVEFRRDLPLGILVLDRGCSLRD